MVKVKKMPGDSDDSLIRKFLKKVMADGVLLEAKRRQFHLKPSAAKKQKKKDRQMARAAARW
ncbi:MAG: 30S ribosomal protein S21 [Patescibacteria group bacterium]|jgi:ribosomal protein S21|nr:30S ribosomal protein S21 [Patescibacteria group bacterium]